MQVEIDLADHCHVLASHDAGTKLRQPADLPRPGCQADRGSRKDLAPDLGADKIEQLLKGTVYKDGEPVVEVPPAEQRLAA